MNLIMVYSLPGLAMLGAVLADGDIREEFGDMPWHHQVWYVSLFVWAWPLILLGD